MRRAALAFALLLAPAAVLAQAPDSTLAPRVRSLEELIRLLRQQLAEQAGAVVVPREGYRVELGGTVLFNGYYNTGNVNEVDAPQVVFPDAVADFPALGPGTIGATVRQSRVSLFALAPRVLNAALTGEIDVDFFGGPSPTTPGRMFPIPRLRRVRADLVWRNASLMIGQEAPLVAEVNPVSLAVVGLPEFASSGNLWLWIPQIRAGLSAGGNFRLGLDVAALAPNGAIPIDHGPIHERAVRSRRPMVQGRAFARWGDPENPSELGVGGHAAWLARDPDGTITSKAVVGAALINLTRVADLRGEFFVGQGLGLLGGGGVGQTLGPGQVPVGTKGGWVQVNLRPVEAVELGVAAGLDDPDDADLDPATAVHENRTYSGHITWRPRPLIFGAAVRRIGTTSAVLAGRAWNTHLNLIVGLTF